MKLKTKYSLALVLLTLAASFAPLFAVGHDNGLLGNFVARTWTSADGLPGNTITDIMQDSTGYIYIGTYEGLVRFDGIEFVTMNRASDKKYDFVSARTVFEDSRRNIWVGSNDESLVRIMRDGNTKVFNAASGLPSTSIRGITEDNEGNIWVGTASGVVYIDRDDIIHVPEGLSDYGEESILVADLFCDAAGRIWVTALKENSLFVYSNSRFERYDKIKSFENPIVTCISQDKEGAYWFGVSPTYAVCQVNGNEKVYNLAHGKQSSTIINTIFQDSGANTWFCGDAGVALLRNGELSFYNTEDGLADINVNHMMEDREGNLWIATDRGGIEKLSLSRFKMIPYPTTINAIAEDKNKNLVWLGGDTGLFCVNSKYEPVENDFTKFCSNVRIRHVEVLRDGDLLVSTYEKYGLLRLSWNGKKTWWKADDGLSGNKVRCTLEARNGDIYVGTTNGLSVISSKDGSITRLGKANGFVNEFIMCLYQDDDGNVWVGTDGGGVEVLSPDLEIIEHFDAANGLAGNVVFKIHRLKGNDLWICTGTGLSLLLNGKFTNYNQTKGLVSDGVFQMILDYTDSVWMTSNRGVSCVKYSALRDLADGKSERADAKLFTRSEGLTTSGVTSTSLSMKDSLGRVWFTLSDGTAVYDPSRVTANSKAPTVQVLSASVDNEIYDIESNRIIVPPSGRRIRIKYTGLSFVSTEQMKFSYFLEGFDHQYSEWVRDRTVSYTNLKPGRYTFTVKAINSDDVQSLSSSPITIIKKPYFWQVWYFWVIISFAVIFLVVFLLWTRYRRLKQYQRQLEHEVAVQTEELQFKNLTLEKQAAELEKKSHDLEIEKEKSEQLLLNILPAAVARELTENQDKIIAHHFPCVSVLFADIVGFTRMSSDLSADVLVTLLNGLFTRFDLRARNEGIEKIKTIGDAYMAACGLSPETNPEVCVKMINFAKGMLEDIQVFNKENNLSLQMRIGVNTGNLVAGVIGKTKFIYDIWGDTVNVASRMESTGMPGKIHVAEDTYSLCSDKFDFSDQVMVEVKGKGLMKTFFLA